MLVYTSFLFLIPCFYAYQKNHTAASTILASLTGTSVIYHTYKHPLTYWLDQAAVYITVFSSFVYGYNGGFAVCMIPTLGNLWNTYVYFYGHRNKSLVFHPDSKIGDFWHGTIHLISAVSYLLLLYYS
jgi:hypothetical protein